MDNVTMLNPRTVCAVGSPFRQELLALLATPDSAAGVARRLGMSRQRVGYHMRELEQAGCIAAAGERPARGLKEKLFRAVPMAWAHRPEGSEPPASLGDRYSWANLVTIATHMLADLVRLRRRADAAGKRLATLALTAELRFESAAERRAFSEELLSVVEPLLRRYDKPRAAGSRSFRLVIGAYPDAAKGEDHGPENAKH